jgi:hypothetical protein
MREWTYYRLDELSSIAYKWLWNNGKLNDAGLIEVEYAMMCFKHFNTANILQRKFKKDQNARYHKK